MLLYVVDIITSIKLNGYNTKTIKDYMQIFAVIYSYTEYYYIEFLNL